MTYKSPADVIKGLPAVGDDGRQSGRGSKDEPGFDKDRLRHRFDESDHGRDYGETVAEGGNRGEYLCAVAGRLKALRLDPDIARAYLVSCAVSSLQKSCQ